jgi:hypothetical protein
MNYSQLLDVECPFPEVCAAAGVEPNSKFGQVLVALLDDKAARPDQQKRVAVHVTFDRDLGGRGFAEDGRTPLTDDELRVVLAAKIKHAEERLAELKARMVALDGPQASTDAASVPPPVN